MGCDVNLDHLKDQLKFYAPGEVHEQIKADVKAIAQIVETTFVVDQPGFEIIVQKQFDQVVKLVKSKCFVDKTLDKQQVQISMPKSRSTNLDTTMNIPTKNIKTVTVGPSTISVAFGDLIAQTVKANKQSIRC